MIRLISSENQSGPIPEPGAIVPVTGTVTVDPDPAERSVSQAFVSVKINKCWQGLRATGQSISIPTLEKVSDLFRRDSAGNFYFSFLSTVFRIESQ